MDDNFKLIQCLNPAGELVHKPSHILSADEHRHLFTTMLQVRLFEERAMKLQRQGRLGFYIGAYGQEASHVASAQAFKMSDWVFPSYRELGILLLRNVPLQQIVNQLYGNADEPTRGAQMPCHYSFKSANFVSISSPIGTHIPHAVGAAMAAKYQGDDMVAVAYLGDGGTSEGDFHVAMNFAAVYKAPVVIIVENNFWAISCRADQQTASANFAIKAQAYGMPGIRVDGNDVLAVYDQTKQAVERARQGGGPTLIENVTYRLFSHSSSDDADRYRDRPEYEEALTKEPMLRYRQYLGREKIWTQAWEDEITQQFTAQLSQAIEKAEAAAKPEINTLFEHLYAQPPALLLEQKRQLEEELKERQSWEAEGAFPL